MIPFWHQIMHLVTALGTRLTAYIGGASTTSEVTEWVDGKATLTPPARDRISMAFDVVRLLENRYDGATIRTWFQGMNDTLGDMSPAQAIAEGDPDLAGAIVRAAARDFAYNG